MSLLSRGMSSAALGQQLTPVGVTQVHDKDKMTATASGAVEADLGSADNEDADDFPNNLALTTVVILVGAACMQTACLIQS